MPSKQKSTRPAHRPTKYTPRLADDLLRLIRHGSVAKACKRLKLDQSTFYDWVIRGESGEAPFSDFAKRYQKAKDERVHYLEERVVEADDVQANLKLLAVINPQRFANRLHVELESTYRTDIERLKKAFADDLVTLEKVLTALAGEGDGIETPPHAG